MASYLLQMQLGQDSRAIEAAANAYAAKSGRYRSLSKWSKDNEW